MWVKTFFVSLVCATALAASASAGTILAWGYDNFNEVTNVPAGNDFVAITGNLGYNGYALRTDGSIAAWGSDLHNQVTARRRERASPQSRPPTTTPSPSAPTARSSPGGMMTLITKYPVFPPRPDLPQSPAAPIRVMHSRPTAQSWAGVAINTAKSRTFHAGTGYKQVSGGTFDGLALRPDGSIAVWGDDTYKVVSEAPTDTGYKAVVGDDFYGLALRTDGSIKVWGDHPSALSNDAYHLISEAPTGTGFTAIAAGYNVAYALAANGSIVAWGNDSGSGEVTDTPTGTNFSAVGASTFTGYALEVPEPTSFALLSLMGLAALLRRRL